MQEICRIGQNFLYTHFIHLHKMLPYPLLDMCRKCEEMLCIGKQDMVTTVEC